MKTTPREDFDQMAAQIGQMVDKLWQWHSGDFCPMDTWSPPVNIYRFDRRVEVAVDLAGVDPENIEVRVEPGTLHIRGLQRAPDPRLRIDEPMRIISMEIDHGPFCRTVQLPDKVELHRVELHYREGLLWIRLPLREPA